MKQEKFSEKLKKSRVAIVGGTGSFGKAFLRYVMDYAVTEIRIVSRDEGKQEDLRQIYPESNITFRICDVRDRQAVIDSLKNIDYVFFAAALKQVPSCEFYPMEAVKTNVLGAQNVIDSCNMNGVKSAVFLSTDKAVYPINAMGQTKAIMEKLVVAKSKNEYSENCKFTVTRYGNVMKSRGSVIPLFERMVHQQKPLTITSFEMTRFMMSLQDSVELVLHAMFNGSMGSIYVSKAPSATLLTLKEAFEIIYERQLEVKEIGVRIGEKMYETLVSSEEMMIAKSSRLHYEIPPQSAQQNFSGYYSVGSHFDRLNEFNSNNCVRLNPTELAQKVKEAW